MEEKMISGYYLSTYLAANSVSYLYDIPIRHDQSVALWRVDENNVELVHYWELERTTGYKQHCISFPSIDSMKSMIEELLSTYGLSIDDMVEIWGTPELEKQNVKYISNDNIEYSVHELAHLYSGLLSDTDLMRESDIIALAIDGGPDGYLSNRHVDYPFYGAICRKGKIIKILTLSSPGFLWNIAKDDLMLREGTLMALASASTSEYLGQISYDFSCSSLKDFFYVKAWYDKIKKEIFSLSTDNISKKINYYDNRFTEKDNKISMLMKVIQKVSIEIMDKNIRKILENYDGDLQNACLAITGGYALNCPTNTFLMKKYGFKKFISPPCVSDSGIAYGIGLMMLYKMNPNMNFRLKNAFYGDEDSIESEIFEEFNEFIKEINPLNSEQFVKDVSNYPVVWFEGRAEIGPRSLGHRSILGDPTQICTKDIINRIKGRQWWRPVAPIVLADNVVDWFDSDMETPYMLQTYKVKNTKKNFVPSILHLDDSARVQTITEDEHTLYALIDAFKNKTGVPMLCNTSLNDKGEPIINTICECLHFALKKDFPVIYINGQRLTLKNHAQYSRSGIYPRKDKWFVMSEMQKKIKMEKENPHCIERDILQFYFEFIYLFKKINLKDEMAKKRIIKYMNFIKNNENQYDEKD